MKMRSRKGDDTAGAALRLRGVVGVCGLGKVRGSTTVAAALAWLVDNETAATGYLVEADEAGGDLNCWWGLGTPRASAALTGRIKSGLGAVDAVEATALAGGLVAAVCTSSDGGGVEPMARSWSRNLKRRGQPAAAAEATAVFEPEASERIVVLDLGRWNKKQRSADRVAVCDVAVALVDPTVEGIDRARLSLGDLLAKVPEVLVAQIGSKPYSAEQVSEHLGVAVQEIELDAKALRSVREGDAKLGLAKSHTASGLRRMLWAQQEDAAVPAEQATAGNDETAVDANDEFDSNGGGGDE